MTRPSVPRVLSIAGTDPSGGAGTAADMKSVTAAGGYGMTVVTCVVAQNTHGVQAIHTPPVEVLAAQLAAVADDVTVDAVKTGMLGTAEVIDTVSAWLDQHRPPVLVVDPVMVATSGDRLLAPEAEDMMRAFCRRATVITPNTPELAVLTGKPLPTSADEAVAMAQAWAEETGVAVVVKTGHLASDDVSNIWVEPGARHEAPCLRVDTSSTHGTGCSLSSALATRLALGESPEQALVWTTDWLHEAIRYGAELQVGSGHGPVDHAHRSRRLQAAGSAAPWLGTGAVPEQLDSPDHLAPGEQPVPVAVPAAGPWTEALWRAGSATTRRTARSGFVQALVAGTLPEPAFAFYLNQDAIYLRRYCRALAALGVSAPDPYAAAFWATSAAGAVLTESELHRSWLQDRPSLPVSPVTSAYTDFLVACTLADPYVVGAAAVLPCFWLYAQVGASLPQVPAGHRYAAWLGTYRDPAFVDAVAEALRHVEAALAAATPVERSEAVRAYLIACRHEDEFFEQALRVEGRP
ncbi:MAG: bifunctional hydroxymethylpyrimidine kinase/phosphomethylpyrimidine kinase [Actinomycetia bacterium]|nr:bifunctional hydroxymethylpyrimidine kinase/phosphomethylpyrimidine kinase [Actinomycetes bacterium]